VVTAMAVFVAAAVVAVVVAAAVAAVVAVATLRDGDGGSRQAPAEDLVVLPKEEWAAAPVPAAALSRRLWCTKWVQPQAAVMAGTAVAVEGPTAMEASATLRGMPPPACSRACQCYMCQCAMQLSCSDGYETSTADRTTGSMDGDRCR